MALDRLKVRNDEAMVFEDSPKWCHSCQVRRDIRGRGPKSGDIYAAVYGGRT